MARKSNSKPWWQTVPAILGGLATLIGAVTGLIIALNQIGMFKGKEPPLDRPAFGCSAEAIIDVRDVKVKIYFGQNR